AVNYRGPTEGAPGSDRQIPPQKRPGQRPRPGRRFRAVEDRGLVVVERVAAAGLDVALPAVALAGHRGHALGRLERDELVLGAVVKQGWGGDLVALIERILDRRAVVT